jgi:hypothetical protein
MIIACLSLVKPLLAQNVYRITDDAFLNILFLYLTIVPSQFKFAASQQKTDQQRG